VELDVLERYANLMNYKILYLPFVYLGILGRKKHGNLLFAKRGKYWPLENTKLCPLWGDFV